MYFPLQHQSSIHLNAAGLTTCLLPYPLPSETNFTCALMNAGSSPQLLGYVCTQALRQRQAR